MSGRPRRPRSGHNKLSQNFLRSERLARRLVALSSIGDDDLVVEPGPGRGVLTAALADVARRVVAVELDPYLADRLREKFNGDARIHIHTDDFLQFKLPDTPYKVFANIPFSRTADIVRNLTLAQRPPDDTYLIIQSEAATRFLGQPFGPESALSLQIKARFDASILAWLSPTDFAPPPSVNSVLLRLRRLDPPRLPDAELAKFDRFARCVMRAGNRPVTSLLKRLLPRNLISSLPRDLGLPTALPPSAISFAHWLTIFQLSEWSRDDR